MFSAFQLPKPFGLALKSPNRGPEGAAASGKIGAADEYNGKRVEVTGCGWGGGGEA